MSGPADVAAACIAPDEWAELDALARVGRTSRNLLDRSGPLVDRLAVAYSCAPRRHVLADVERLHRLLMAPSAVVGPADRSRAVRQAAWLDLLRACLLHDGGEPVRAEEARARAASLGSEVEDGVAVAWSHEIKAWMALTAGDHARVLDESDAGVAAAPHSDVAAQLHAQAAKAAARQGDRGRVLSELDAVRTVLDRTREAADTRHHFVVDPSKADFFSMDVHRALGDDESADTLADVVIASAGGDDGAMQHPMRAAEAELTKAVVRARAGDVDGALRWAERALARDRQSVPSLALVVDEVALALAVVAPGSVHDLRAHLDGLVAGPSSPGDRG